MISEKSVWAALPREGFVRAYTEAHARASDGHVIFQVGGALAALSQAVDSRLIVRQGNKIFPNIYVLLVGESYNARKSTAVAFSREIVQEWRPEHVGEEPGSQEGLVESLRQQRKQLLAYEEFGDFLKKTEQGYLSSIRLVMTNVWDGAPVGRALKAKNTQSVRDARLSIIGGSTLAYIEQATDEADWKGGFMSRFLTLLTKRERNFPLGAALSIPEIPTLTKMLTDMASFSGKPGDWMGFDREADELFQEWNQTIYAKALLDTPDSVRASVSRTPGQLWKIAALMAWDRGEARSGEPWYFRLSDVFAAVMMATCHLHSVVEIGHQIVPSRDMRDRRAVLNAIGYESTAYGTIITKAQLLKFRVGHILDSLIEEGAVSREEGIGVVGAFFHRNRQESSSSPSTISNSTPAPSESDSSPPVSNLFGDVDEE